MNFENFQNPEKLQIVNFTIPFEFFKLESFFAIYFRKFRTFDKSSSRVLSLGFWLDGMNRFWLVQLEDIRIQRNFTVI